jgi:hypothetical protein
MDTWGAKCPCARNEREEVVSFEPGVLRKHCEGTLMSQ